MDRDEWIEHRERVKRELEECGNEDEGGIDLTPGNDSNGKGWRDGHRTRRRRKREVVEEPVVEEDEEVEELEKERSFNRYEIRGEERATQFLLARSEGMSRGDALEAAGYSRANGSLEGRKSFRRAVANLDRERSELQGREGYRLTDIAKRFKDRATNEDVPPHVQNDADKALVSVLDYTPSKKVDITSTGLLVEFRDVPMSELLKMRERITGEVGGDE